MSDAADRIAASAPVTEAIRLAMRLHQAGDHGAAARIYRQILRDDALHPDALQLLGLLEHQAGRYEAAAELIARAIDVAPHAAVLHSNLGEALRCLGRLDDAARSYQQAVALDPGYADAHHNLGVVAAARGQTAEAVEHYRRALAIRPNYAEALCNLGLAVQEQGQLQEAAALFNQAAALAPTLVQAHFNLGNALHQLGRTEDAVAAYDRALAIEPDYTEAENQLMHRLQHLCDWRRIEAIVERQRQAIAQNPAATISPFTILCIPSTPAEQLACAKNLVANRLAPLVATRREALGFRHERRAKGRLRIGYLSSDFHAHATAYLIAELFELHDRAGFETIAYSYGPDDASPIRKRLVAACDRFVEIGALFFAEAAQRIYEDGVDILVDLKGYTTGARSAIPALRPAPVQVSYLGYPGTMGAAFIDYLVTDRFVTPPERAYFYAEKLVYMPECYQVNDRKRPIARRTPPRSELGLPAEGFVFCCFNNPYKIMPPIFERWVRLLAAVPGSALWLLESNRAMAGNLRREAAVRGLDRGRLVFAPRVPIDEHLARFRAADLFLDTLPYNAHTTASDALWAGLPVLTCAGETFASRVAGSLLKAVGLPELITASLDDYEAAALRLAENRSELAGLRARLAANRLEAPLFDSERFTRHLETAYRMMWQTYLEGRAPTMIEVPPLPR
jgi:predicted O-linked N-acetylglucosamine transferase (SPINDLY family)